MTNNELKALQMGDVVRLKGSAVGYIVTANYGDHVTATRTVDITNSQEWDLVAQASYANQPITTG